MTSQILIPIHDIHPGDFLKTSATTQHRGLLSLHSNLCEPLEVAANKKGRNEHSTEYEYTANKEEEIRNRRKFSKNSRQCFISPVFKTSHLHHRRLHQLQLSWMHRVIDQLHGTFVYCRRTMNLFKSESKTNKQKQKKRREWVHTSQTNEPSNNDRSMRGKRTPRDRGRS